MPILFSLAVCRNGDDVKEALILTAEHELSSFSYFTRGSVQEMCTFCARTFVTRSQRGSRQTIDYQGNQCHVYVRLDGLAAVAITDKEYPDRVAHTLLQKMLNEFETAHPKWASYKEDYVANGQFDWLTSALAKYQDPAQADSLSKIQKELDLTKEFMHKNIESMLDRGEKIDSLVEKSNDLNSQSKLFYKQASKMNSCCVIS